MKLTEEQELVVKTSKNANILKVNAYPGTGKTFILSKIAEANIHSNILYLAFNSAIVNEAKGKFPSNTTIKTTHSLAFNYTKEIHDGRIRSNITTIETAKTLKVNYKIASIINTTLSLFLSSSYVEINEEIISKLINNENYIEEDKISIDYLANEVTKLFKKIYNNEFHGYPHDYYLKCFQMKNNKINKFDLILLDEAQDTNEVTMDIFNKIKGRKIVVGDSHQQIYNSLRHTINPMQNLKSDYELYLTKSFRLKKQVAEYTSNILNNFKNEKHEIDGISTEKVDDRIAIISRTNSMLIEYINDRLKANDFTCVRDPNSIFSTAIDAFYIINDQLDRVSDIKFKYITKRSQLDTLAIYDIEVKNGIKIAEKYGTKLFELRDGAMKAVCNKNTAKFTFTTAHTSKGLEFSNVKLAEDFPDPVDLILKKGIKNLDSFYKRIDNDYNSVKDIIEEINLFFVAATRSKNSLEVVKDYYMNTKDEINEFLSYERNIV